jgi:phosphoserine phosphatase
MKPLALIGVCFFVLLGSAQIAWGEEPDDSRILRQILDTRTQLLKTVGDTNPTTPPAFLAVWDFDGTILKGDCSEGLKEGDKTIYPGLAQFAIEHGLSELYPAQGGFTRFWTDYTNMDTRIGHWLAYPFIPQMLRGAEISAVLRLSESHFSKTMSNYLMASSVKIIHALEQNGVECHILSASADLFVKGAAASLGLPASHIHGIEVRAQDGKLTEELVYPITWNVGKLRRLNQIVADIVARPGNRKVFVLAGFGDNYHTDGPFLKFIATQSFPAGNPIAVFYGEGAPPSEYAGVFFQTRHRATVSDKSGP